MLENLDKIFCLTLKESKERRQHAQQELKSINISNFQFFFGTNKLDPIVKNFYENNLVFQYPPCFRCGKLTCENDECNNILVKAQVATFISHMSIWKAIVENNYRTALIIEDDIKFNDYALQILGKLNKFEEIKSFLKAENPCLLRLGWALNQEHNYSGEIRLVKNCTKMSNPCYAITNPMAQILINKFEKIYTTADVYLHQDIASQYENYTLFPPLAHELSWSVGSVDSLIHPKPIRLNYLSKNNVQNQTALEKAKAKIENHFNHVLSRNILAIGHPRSGSGYSSKLLQAFGLDIGHELMGKDGISSWMFAVIDEKNPFALNKYAITRRYTYFQYIIHHVRNPKDAIPSIIRENKFSKLSFQFRNKHLKKQFGIDLNDYVTELEKAAWSFLYWNKIIKQQNPDLVIRVESDRIKLLKFLREKKLTEIDNLDSITLPSTDFNANKKYQGVFRKKPILVRENWDALPNELKIKLNDFCEEYNYPLIYSSLSKNKIMETGQNLIFLISQPRAGSTLTQKILGSHSEIHTISEPWLMLHPLYGLKNQGYQTEYGSQLTHEALQNTFQELLEGRETYIQGIRKMYTHVYTSLLTNSKKQYFLDKTPRYYNIIPELYETFPSAKYLILLRNPLAVCASIINTWVYSDSNTNWNLLREHLLDLLKAPVLILESIKNLGDKVHIIKYENLLVDPQKEVRKILSFLNLGFEENIIDYQKDKLWQLGDQKKVYQDCKPDSNNVDRWIKTLSDINTWKLINDYLNYLGEETLETMGYDYDYLNSIIKSNQPQTVKSTISLSKIFPEIDTFRQWKEKSYVFQDYFVDRLNLQTLNLIIFPDWQQSEEELSLTLAEVLRAIASHPQAKEITLVIDVTNAENEEEANLLVSGVALNLMLEEDIELPETTEIAFIGNLPSSQWKKLFTFIQYRISIDNEYLPMNIELLPIYKHKITFPKIYPIKDKSNRPFWSVMIPTYNKFEHLEQTLKSVLDQAPSSEEMQIEVINDHPDSELQDQMEALVKRIGGNRVNFYRHTSTNIGQTAIFNLCLQRAIGHWIHLLHDDDYILPGFYQKLRQGIEINSEIRAAFCRHYLVNGNSENLSLSSLEKQESGVLSNYIERLALISTIEAVSVVAKRDVFEHLGGYCPEALFAADWEMWKRVACHYNIWYEPEPLACRRMDRHTQTSNLVANGKCIKHAAKAIEITDSYLPENLRSKRLSQIALEQLAVGGINLANNYLSGNIRQDELASFYLDTVKQDTIIDVLVESLKCNPTDKLIDYVIKVIKQNQVIELIQPIYHNLSEQEYSKNQISISDRFLQRYNLSNESEKIKIAFDISVLGAGYLLERARTGVFRVVEYILKELIASSQFDLLLCSSIPSLFTACRKYLDKEFKYDDLPLFTVSALRLQNIDLYHSPFHPIPPEIYYCRRIITICDLIPIKFPEFFDYKEDSLIKNSLNSITKNDFALCISEATKKDVLEYNERLSEQQVNVTHLAADKNKFYACKDANWINNIHQKYQIPETPYLLSVCTLEPRKNLVHVIRCFLKLIQEKEIDDLNLVLVGTRGWQYDEIFAELNQNANLGQRIISTGFVPDEDLAPLYSDALAFLYLSLYEGFGLPPLEAMQCGTPVITSNTSSLPEVVGEAGIMLSPDDVDGLCDAIFELYIKSDFREVLSSQSLKQSEKFTWEKTLQETVNVYKLAAESEFLIPSPQIIIDGVFFQLYQTGIARVWKSLLEKWANTDFADHILVLDRAGTAPKIPGIRYRTVAVYNYNDTDVDRQMLQQVCNEEGAELFISTYYTTPIDTPSVFMAYDMIPEVVGADLSLPMWQEKHKGINHASALIAISKNTAQDITKFLPNMSLDSISVAHCGVDPLFSPASDAEINTFKYRYGINNLYFLLGSLSGYKNSILFFKAFAQLANKQGFDVVVTGADNQLPPEWRQYTAGCTVHSLQLTDEELRLAYAGAVALVYPSKYEGFGMPLIEAMACGCPVITCANGSIPEVAGEAAIYVNDDDVEGMTNAIYEVQKPSVRDTLFSAGLQQAKQFSWSEMANTVSSVLINTTLLRLNLKEHNFIIFPDWSQPEESVGLELQEVIETLSTHPNREKTTLLIDTSNINVEDAELFLYSVAMNLFMNEDSDITEELEIALVGDLADMQWKALLPRIQARIILRYENQEVLEKSFVQKLPHLEIEKFKLSKV